MSNFILCCGSTADLSAGHLKRRNIEYIPFHYFLDEKEYADDLGQTMPLSEFYKAMVNGAVTRTSQINSGELEDYLTPFLEDGNDVLYVSLSSGISGAYQSSLTAVEELKAKYPDRKIYTLDSLAASSGYGLFMDKLADLRDAGKTIEEVYEWGTKNRLKVHHWFFSTDLTFYIKGGRVSKVSGWFGTVLKICPLLNVSVDGRLIPRQKVRTKKRVIEEIVNKMVEHAENGLDYSGKCYMCNSDCFDDAKQVAELVEKKFKKLNGKVEINNIGPTIGSHTGPGTVALFFWGDERVD